MIENEHIIDANQMMAEVLPAVPAAAPVTLFRTDEPSEVLRRATATADSLADAVRDRKLMARIGQKDYPTVEAWTMLGTMLGVFPVCVWTRPLENGWEARVEARTLSGQLVGAAEAQCTRSERSWGNRDDYALRSMAQTRATGKALRLPLGFIMSLAGYDATPAEEFIDEKTSNRVNARTGEIVAEATVTGSASQLAAGDAVQGEAEVETSVVAPDDSPASPPSQQTHLDTYVPEEPGPDDVPFVSTAPPTIEAEADGEIVYEPAQMARAALIRRTLGVMVSHGVPVTEENIFDRIAKLSNDGRSVFYGFGGTEFEDLSESQATKVMAWLEEGAKKYREETP